MLEAIQQLYAAGIDCGVESYQGVGVLAWIVTPGQRRLERSFTMSELDGIGDWLRAEAVSSKSAEVGPVTRGAHEILGELAESRRKGPHRVSIDERHARMGRQSSPSQAAS